ncbi:MAG: carboxypeptidase regulatory-like domain-containing protein [Geobacter sp.]|nr:carboxypeptidase regulatory-like domain-containing protein [Geobacter sp.]
MTSRLTAIIAVVITLSAAVPACGGDNIIISGRIMSIGSNPVSGAEVYLYVSDNTRKPADFISPKTATDGIYRMVVPKTRYKAVARIKKGERYGPLMPGDRHSGEPVTVIPDEENAITLDFTVADMQELAQKRTKDRLELTEIRGKISAGGKVIASAYAFARTGKIAATIPEHISSWTDAEGNFSLKLPKGEYFLGAAVEFPPPDMAMELKEVTVKDGDLPVAINLQLPAK